MLKDIFASISKPKAGPIEYLIVGLGNPGIQYEGTRHNVGFMVLDYIAKQCNVSIDRMKFNDMRYHLKRKKGFSVKTHDIHEFKWRFCTGRHEFL